MSAWATGNVWRTSHATGSARLVLLALAHVADDRGRASISTTELASMCILSEASVRRGRRALERSGDIEVLTRGNGRTVSTYLVGGGR